MASEILRGFIVIRRQRVEAWSAVMGGDGECLVFESREAAEGWVEGMTTPRDWDVVAVSVAPSETSPGGAGGPYCVRCHRTEPLHHEPNIYTHFRDPLGHPAPTACEEFQAPEVCCRSCGVRLSVTTVRDGNDCGACGRAAPTVESP